MSATELPHREHADHHGHAPPEGDHDPARVLSLGQVQQHAGDHAVAQQDQERCPDHLSSEDAQTELSFLSVELPTQRAVTLTLRVRRCQTGSNRYRVRTTVGNAERFRLISACARHDPVDRARRRHPAAPVRPQPPAGRRADRGRARPAQGHRARDPAHAGRRRVRRAGRRGRQVPARRRAAAHGQLVPGRQRAADPRAQLVGLARRAQRRERPDRHAARDAGCSSCTTSSGRTTAARRSRSARCCPAHATAMGKVLLAPNRYAAAELAERRAAALHAGHDHRLGRARRRARAPCRSAAGRSTPRSSWSGVVSLAAPIQDRRGVTVGAIGISGPVERLIEDGEPRHRPGVVRARGRARRVARPRRHPVVAHRNW